MGGRAFKTEYCVYRQHLHLSVDLQQQHIISIRLIILIKIIKKASQISERLCCFILKNIYSTLSFS